MQPKTGNNDYPHPRNPKWVIILMQWKYKCTFQFCLYLKRNLNIFRVIHTSSNIASIDKAVCIFLNSTVGLVSALNTYNLWLFRQESQETREASWCCPNFSHKNCTPADSSCQSSTQTPTGHCSPQREEEHLVASRGAPKAAEGGGRCHRSQEVQDKLMKCVIGILTIFVQIMAFMTFLF